MADIERISTWMKCTRNYHSHVITQHQETVAMTSTTESKRVFKSQTALKWRWMNIQCNPCFLLILRIYIYIFFFSFKYPVWWQKLLGSTRSGSTALSYQNCVITLVGGWWGQGIARAFIRCMMKNIYIYRDFYFCTFILFLGVPVLYFTSPFDYLCIYLTIEQ